MSINLRENIQEILNSSALNDSDLASRLIKTAMEQLQNDTEVKQSVSINELCEQSASKIRNNSSQNLLSGYSGLDAIIGGFYPGELIVIGGRPAMGKTQLAINLTLKISKEYPVLYFTFDLAPFLLGGRFISTMSNIEVSKILNNELDNEEKGRYSSALNNMNQHKVFVTDSCRTSLANMNELINWHVKQHNVKVVFIDYLQLMSLTRYRQNREQEIGEIFRELKRIARQNDLYIFITSQLSRSVEQRGGSKEPILSDLKESGTIEQDSDKVILLHRPEYYGFLEDIEGESTVGITNLIVAKNRNGKTGTAKLVISNELTSFTDYEDRTGSFRLEPFRLKDLRFDT